jgi:hypothetical protein
MMVLILVAVAWGYVALMMAVAEATNPAGSVLGAFFTLLLYGVLPVALILYLGLTPARKRALRAREALEAEARAESAAGVNSESGLRAATEDESRKVDPSPPAPPNRGQP